MPATIPMPLRLDKSLIATLNEGRRRTPHKKQELVRITLRRYLPVVIEEEAIKKISSRLTNVEPWPTGALRRAWKVTDKDWKKIEGAATKTQGVPDFSD